MFQDFWESDCFSSIFHFIPCLIIFLDTLVRCISCLLSCHLSNPGKPSLLLELVIHLVSWEVVQKHSLVMLGQFLPYNTVLKCWKHIWRCLCEYFCHLLRSELYKRDIFSLFVQSFELGVFEWINCNTNHLSAFISLHNAKNLIIANPRRG